MLLLFFWNFFPFLIFASICFKSYLNYSQPNFPLPFQQDGIVSLRITYLWQQTYHSATLSSKISVLPGYIWPTSYPLIIFFLLILTTLFLCLQTSLSFNPFLSLNPTLPIFLCLTIYSLPLSLPLSIFRWYSFLLLLLQTLPLKPFISDHNMSIYSVQKCFGNT